MDKRAMKTTGIKTVPFSFESLMIPPEATRSLLGELYGVFLRPSGLGSAGRLLCTLCAVGFCFRM